jgi:hypothetical protein
LSRTRLQAIWQARFEQHLRLRSSEQAIAGTVDELFPFAAFIDGWQRAPQRIHLEDLNPVAEHAKFPKLFQFLQ